LTVKYDVAVTPTFKSIASKRYRSTSFSEDISINVNSTSVLTDFQRLYLELKKDSMEIKKDSMEIKKDSMEIKKDSMELSKNQEKLIQHIINNEAEKIKNLRMNSIRYSCVAFLISVLLCLTIVYSAKSVEAGLKGESMKVIAKSIIPAAWLITFNQGLAAIRNFFINFKFNI